MKTRWFLALMVALPIANAGYAQEPAVPAVPATPTPTFSPQQNIERVIRERDEKLKETQVREAAAQEERKQLTEILNRDYKPVVEVYSLEKLAPVTANSLAQQQLRRYALFPKKTDYDAQSWGHTEVDGKYWQIISTGINEGGNNQMADVRSEMCMVDVATRTLIVEAAPATHQRIVEILKKMDRVIAAPDAATSGSFTQYSIELVLLQVVDSQATAGTAGAGGRGSMATGAPSVPYTRPTPPPPMGAVPAQPALPAMPQMNVGASGGSASIPGGPSVTWGAQPGMSGMGPVFEGGHGMFMGMDAGRTPSPAKPAEDYGISKEDQKLFGFEKVSEVGRAVVRLSANPGEDGAVRAALSNSYSTELQYRDYRKPYLILRASLEAQKSEKPLLENTVHLQPDKPAILGLTNLKEALVLILRLHGQDSHKEQERESVTKTVPRNGELAFRDLRVRVDRINANDAADKSDDSVQLLVRTSTMSEDLPLVIAERERHLLEGYQIWAIDVQPDTDGEGSAHLMLSIAQQGLGPQ